MRAMSKPCEAKLEDLITRHMARPGNVKKLNDTADFVISGIRAAMSANSRNRRKILSDIASVMSCVPADLEFLLSDFEVSGSKAPSYDVMIPDFQSILLDAAE